MCSTVGDVQYSGEVCLSTVGQFSIVGRHPEFSGGYLECSGGRGCSVQWGGIWSTVGGYHDVCGVW